MAKEKQSEHVSPLDRAIQQAMGEGRIVGSEDDPAKERWPELWRWMVTIYVGRDDMKQPATITIRAAPGGIVISLTDRDLGVTVDAATAHLEDALDALEQSLTSKTPSMRAWSNKEPTLRKRKHRS